MLKLQKNSATVTHTPTVNYLLCTKAFNSLFAIYKMLVKHSSHDTKSTTICLQNLFANQISDHISLH